MIMHKMVHQFLAMVRDRTSNLTFSIFVGDALSVSFLYCRQQYRKSPYTIWDKIVGRTLVKTAMEAYEFPKLIPTTAG